MQLSPHFERRLQVIKIGYLASLKIKITHIQFSDGFPITMIWLFPGPIYSFFRLFFLRDRVKIRKFCQPLVISDDFYLYIRILSRIDTLKCII
jgi:hypothetical protein